MIAPPTCLPWHHYTNLTAEGLQGLPVRHIEIPPPYDWLSCRITNWLKPKPKPFVSHMGLGPGPLGPRARAHLGPGPTWAWAHLGPGPTWPRAHLGPGPTWPWAHLGPGPTWARAHLGPGPFGPGPTWARAHLGPGPLGPWQIGYF